MKEAKIYKMKKLLSILVFSLLLSGSGYANDFNFICQEEIKTEKLSNTKLFYELKKNNFFIDGVEYLLKENPKILDNSITLIWRDDEGWIFESIFNKKNGKMVEKGFKGPDDKSPAIWYYQCDIF